jgi:hypothetical protein
MKKEYVMPAIKVVELKMESLMATTSSEITGAGTSDRPGDGGDMASSHRGSWGDLWN